jgi:hypothetical protein
MENLVCMCFEFIATPGHIVDIFLLYIHFILYREYIPTKYIICSPSKSEWNQCQYNKGNPLSDLLYDLWWDVSLLDKKFGAHSKYVHREILEHSKTTFQGKMNCIFSIGLSICPWCKFSHFFRSVYNVPSRKIGEFLLCQSLAAHEVPALHKIVFIHQSPDARSVTRCSLLMQEVVWRWTRRPRLPRACRRQKIGTATSGSSIFSRCNFLNLSLICPSQWRGRLLPSAFKTWFCEYIPPFHFRSLNSTIETSSSSAYSLVGTPPYS